MTSHIFTVSKKLLMNYLDFGLIQNRWSPF
ncbi:hypothetical protein CAEBREN_04533 [Caenorhabditis brenneri]|uniref:Uncharacterized protein n=1 Tax=Caenorhabditis brenneri TaxID=135651 RepID=G0PHW3_CAEBE|nr:hypothetical protein CAEBREN_04533 [Caenorhabditis brenneri]